MKTLVEAMQALGAHPMFVVGLLLMAGYIIGKQARRIGLPEISGYIFAGLLVGYFTADIFPVETERSFAVITEIALSLIALTIGVEFSLSKLRRIGADVLVITATQIVLVLLVVGGALWLFGMGLPYALLLGVIATATEPAATVAEVYALRARGRFIDYLFSIVALDDACCVIIFSVVLSVVARLLYGTRIDGAVAGLQVVLAFKEILFSLLLGLLAGGLLHRLTRRTQGNNEILIVTLGLLFITTAIAIVTHLSPLLVNLAAGSLLINVSPRNYRLLRTLEPLTPPVYALFFVIAGTKLDFSVMLQPGLLLLGVVYIFARAASKYGGVYLGCRLRNVSGPLRRNLGWCMLPQGGVALGLILLLQSSPLVERIDSADVDLMLVNMLNIVLMCVLVSELLGPPLSRRGILRGCGQLAGARLATESPMQAKRP